MATNQAAAAIDQAMKEEAQMMARELLQTLDRVSNELEVTMGFYEGACNAEMWLLNSRRMRCYPQAFEAAIAAISTVSQMAQSVREAPTGAMGIEMATYAVTIWGGYKRDVARIEQLLKDTIDDLHFNSHITQVMRIYNQTTYEIFNLFGGLGQGMLTEEQLANKDNITTSDLFGSGGFMNVSGGESSLLGESLGSGREKGFWGWFTLLLVGLLLGMVNVLSGNYTSYRKKFFRKGRR